MALNEDRLQSTEARYEELSMLIADPAVLADQNRYLKLIQEYHEVEPLVQNIRRLRELRQGIEENKILLTESDEQDFRDMAREEIQNMEREAAQCEAEIDLALTPKDPNDEKDVIVEIRGGAGGDEAALFAANLFRMYAAYAEKRDWKIEVLDMNETELGGLKELVFRIIGRGAYSVMKFESGVHRVQRVPVTESGGRIHTSTVTVAVLPEAEDVELEINPKDLQIDTYRSSGAGGQHVNKTSSAIRITHLPTGLVVTCQDQRSQHENRDRAMLVLKTRLLDMERQKQEQAVASDRKEQVGSGDRSERIRTYNYPQSRVTDHRVGLTLYQLDTVLNGDLDPFFKALQLAQHEARIQHQEASL